MNGKWAVFSLLLVWHTVSHAGVRVPVDPAFEDLLAERRALFYSFDTNGVPFAAQPETVLSVTGGVLRVESRGVDPGFRVPLARLRGPVVVRWRMRSGMQAPAEMFWASEEHPGYSAERRVKAAVTAAGGWLAHEARIAAGEVLTSLRVDPGTSAGWGEIDDFEVIQQTMHPLQLVELDYHEGQLSGALTNAGSQRLVVQIENRSWMAGPGELTRFELRVPRTNAFVPYLLKIRSEGLPDLSRQLFWHQPTIETTWLELKKGDITVQVDAAACGARLLRRGREIGFIYPLVQHEEQVVPLQGRLEGERLRLTGGVVEFLDIELAGEEIHFRLKASEEVTGPAVRVPGLLEQGLLAGVEHLGRGERSSSKLDLETRDHVRYEPKPLLVTMPLASLVTSVGAIHASWTDPRLQPVFAAPNRYDATRDHLFTLKGPQIDFHLRLGPSFAEGERLETGVLWAVKKRGLPELPPETPQATSLYLQAFNQSLRRSNGWLHATWADSRPAWFADHASSIFRLSGRLPDLPALVGGGSHVPDPLAFFLRGESRRWVASLGGQAAALRAEQKPDGSFRYQGKYGRGHFEDTASGYCAVKTWPLLEHARMTGDAASLAAGLRGLEFMKRFRTPRGAQTWEMPLHTPDLVAAAALVKCYILGYELAQKREYLDLARRWALAGVPYVYQWGEYPIQRYATIGVLGATDWTGVVWIGLPVQWCGTVYAEALSRLEPYDRTLEWRRMIEGILRCSEQMLYPDGEFAGALPDSFDLAAQRRQPAGVNPCVLVALRGYLAGQRLGPFTASNAVHRLVSPFPVMMDGETARIQGRAGVDYEVLDNLTNVLRVTSQGQDILRLSP